MSDHIDIDTSANPLNSLLQSQVQAQAHTQVVNPEDAALRDKRAYYELLVRAGFFLPKLSS